MTTVTFNSYIPKHPYDHYANGPINWSGITKMEKLDRTNPGNDSVDDRNQYYIIVTYFDHPTHQEFFFGF
jgi:hypothetical protein